MFFQLPQIYFLFFRRYTCGLLFWTLEYLKVAFCCMHMLIAAWLNMVFLCPRVFPKISKHYSGVFKFWLRQESPFNIEMLVLFWDCSIMPLTIASIPFFFLILFICGMDHISFLYLYSLLFLTLSFHIFGEHFCFHLLYYWYIFLQYWFFSFSCILVRTHSRYFLYFFYIPV